MTAAPRSEPRFTLSGGLRPTVIAFCTLLLALMWTGLAYQLAYERNYAFERREAENDNLARLFEEHVRRTLAAASVTLKALETEYRRHGERLDIAEYFHNRREELAPYSVLSVVDENGILILSSVPFTKPQNYRNFENTQFHLRNASQEVFIAKPRPGAVTGRPTIYLTRRMNKPDGSFGGNTGVGMDPQYFSRFYEQIEFGPDSVVALVGLDGIVRARRSNTRSAGEDGAQDMRGAPLLTLHLAQARDGKFRAISPIDGVARLYSYRSVEPYPLAVLVGASEAATLAKFEERRKLYLGTAGAASAVILAFAALVLFQISRAARVTGALRRSEERYALVERGTNDGIWDRNLQTGEGYLSPRGKEILDFAEDGMRVGQEIVLERLHPDDAARVTQAMERSAKDGTPYRIEYRLPRRDGGYRWILSRGEAVRDENGDPVRLIGSISDITEHKDAERHVREQARLLDLIFRHSLDSIVLLDKDYNFIRVSDSYAKATGREASAFPGRNHFELYPSELQQELEPYRREKKVYSRAARPFVFPDHPEWGTTYWDLGLVPILKGSGEVEFFLFTLKDVTGQVRAESKAGDYMARIRALSGRLVAVQEEERRAVARELHDEVGQGLTAVKIHLQATQLACLGCKMSSNLHAALAATATLLEQVRNLSLNLRPMLLDDLGLTVALQSLLMRDAATAGWIARFDEDLGGERLDANLELACYRVAQEALTNVMRHAGATEVWLTLRRRDRELYVTVRDNGHGLDAASARSATGTPHLGLLGMEERVRQLAGQFEIQALRGGGTEVRASFPLAVAVTVPAGRA